MTPVPSQNLRQVQASDASSISDTHNSERYVETSPHNHPRSASSFTPTPTTISNHTKFGSATPPRPTVAPTLATRPRWRAVPKTVENVTEYDRVASRWYVDRTPWARPGVVPEVVRVAVPARVQKVDATLSGRGERDIEVGEDEVLRYGDVNMVTNTAAAQTPNSGKPRHEPPSIVTESPESMGIDSPVEVQTESAADHEEQPPIRNLEDAAVDESEPQMELSQMLEPMALDSPGRYGVGSTMERPIVADQGNSPVTEKETSLSVLVSSENLVVTESVPEDEGYDNYIVSLAITGRGCHSFPALIDSPSSSSLIYESPYLGVGSALSPENPIVYPSLLQQSQTTQIEDDDTTTASQGGTPTPPIKSEICEDSPSQQSLLGPSIRPIVRQSGDEEWSQKVGNLLNAIGHPNTQTASPTHEPPPEPTAQFPPLPSPPLRIGIDLQSSLSPPPISPKSQTSPPSDSPEGDSESDEPIVAPRRRKPTARPTSVSIAPAPLRPGTPTSVLTSPNFSSTPTPGPEPNPETTRKKHLKRKRDLPDSQSPDSQPTNPPSTTPSAPTSRSTSRPPPRKRGTRTTRASLVVSSLPEHIELHISNYTYTQAYAMKFILEQVPASDLFSHMISAASLGTFGYAEASRVDCHNNKDLRNALGDIIAAYLQHSLKLLEIPPELTVAQYEVLKSGEDAFPDLLEKLRLTVEMRISVLRKRKPPPGEWVVTVEERPSGPPPPGPEEGEGGGGKEVKEEPLLTPQPVGGSPGGERGNGEKGKARGERSRENGSRLVTSYFMSSSPAASSASQKGTTTEVTTTFMTPTPKQIALNASPLRPVECWSWGWGGGI